MRARNHGRRVQRGMGYDSAPTLCQRIPNRFRSTIALKTPTTRARAALAATRSLAGLKLAEAWPFHRSRSLTSRVCWVSAEKNRFFDVVCPTNLA